MLQNGVGCRITRLVGAILSEEFMALLLVCSRMVREIPEVLIDRTFVFFGNDFRIFEARVAVGFLGRVPRC